MHSLVHPAEPMKVIQLIPNAHNSGYHELHCGKAAIHTHRVIQGASMHTNTRATDAAHVTDVRNHQTHIPQSKMLQFVQRCYEEPQSW